MRSRQPTPVRPLGLLGLKPRAGSDDEDVVRKIRAVVEVDDLVVERNAIHGRDSKLDLAAQLLMARAHDVRGAREAERDEEQPRLVDVAVVLIDDHDLSATSRPAREAVWTSVPPVPAPKTTILDGMTQLCLLETWQATGEARPAATGNYARGGPEARR